MIEKILKGDLWAKAGAVALAVLAWLEVTKVENPLETRNVYIDLELSKAPPKIVRQYDPRQVMVTVQGLARTLDQIDFDNLAIPIDISELETGENEVQIPFESPAAGVTVTGISPQTVSLVLDVTETRPVNVSVQTRGTPNEEFTALSPVSDVDSVKVTGPSVDLARVVAVIGVVDISGATGSIEGQQVTLTAVDAQSREVKGVTIEPSSIPVSVPMSQKAPAKNVAVKASTHGTPKKGYRVASVSVEPGSVRIRGDVSVTANLSSINTSVDVTDRSQSFTYQAILNVPQGVQLESPRSVSVTVQIEEEIVQTTLKNVIVQFEKSLPAGFEWQLNPTTVDITIEGRSDIVAEIKDEDVQAFVDPSWVKEAGSHKLFVNAKGLPDSVRFKDIVPTQVILELK